MQATVCPLCKNPSDAHRDVATANGVATNGVSRLCESCRSMIAVIRPHSSPVLIARNLAPGSSHAQESPAAAVAEISQSNHQLYNQTAGQAETFDALSFSPPADVAAPLRFEPASAVQPQTFAQPLEFENPFAPSAVTVPNAPVEENLWASEAAWETGEGTNESAVQAQQGADAGQENLPLQPPAATPFVFGGIGRATAADETGAAQNSYPRNAGEDAEEVESRRLDGTEINDVPRSWDEPEDYPILMVQKEEKSATKLFVPLAAALVLVAVLAAGYFFVYQPYFANRDAEGGQQNAAPGGEAQAPVTPPQSATAEQTTAAAEPTPASPATSAPATAPSGVTAETPANAQTSNPTDTQASPPAGNEAGGQGKFSLQAASFPNEAGANELSEKLIRAGVPAYVASANLAGKGMWYRVRVGRFATSTDAEKFAAQAKQRAKALGMNIQLVVCEYGK